MGKFFELLDSLIGKINSSVKTEAQSLTAEQKAQARTNIGAAAVGEGGGSDDAVLFTKQTLTEEQKVQARANIGAPSASEFNTKIGSLRAGLSAFQAGALTWDGVIGDRPYVPLGGNSFLVNISETVPTGLSTTTLVFVCSFSLTDGAIGNITAFEKIMADGAYIAANSILIVPYDNYALEGLTFQKKGLYVVAQNYLPMGLDASDAYISSVYIPGHAFHNSVSWNELENRPFGESETLLELLPETEVTGSSTGPFYYEQFTLPEKAEMVDVAHIVYDGVKYVCKTLDELNLDPNSASFGNASIVSSSLEDTGEPFCFVYSVDETGCKCYIYKPDSTAHTISVALVTHVITPLNEKYLPNVVTDAVILYADSENYLYADSDTSDTSKRITKSQLETFVKSSRSIRVALEDDGMLIYFNSLYTAFSDSAGIIMIYNGAETAQYSTAPDTATT